MLSATAFLQTPEQNGRDTEDPPGDKDDPPHNDRSHRTHVTRSPQSASFCSHLAGRNT